MLDGARNMQFDVLAVAATSMNVQAVFEHFADMSYVLASEGNLRGRHPEGAILGLGDALIVELDAKRFQCGHSQAQRCADDGEPNHGPNHLLGGKGLVST